MGNTVTLRDGALRNNNPINELMDELKTEFGDPPVGCVVSVGTGVSRTEFFGNGLASIAKACAKIATDVAHTTPCPASISTSGTSDSKSSKDYKRLDLKSGRACLRFGALPHLTLTIQNDGRS
jgi:hypothetical protein